MKIEFERAVLEDADAINEVHNLSFYADYVKYGACPGYNLGYTCRQREKSLFL